MTERAKPAKLADVGFLTAEGIKFQAESAEHPDERASRLRREEAEETYKRRIGLMLHVFVMAVVFVAFAASVGIALFKDPKTGLPDKAIGVIVMIVSAAVGYLTGKGSK